MGKFCRISCKIICNLFFHFYNRNHYGRNINNTLGGTFFTVYTDNGNIEDIVYNPVLYSKNNVWDECGLDRNKVKHLVIK